jgi:hypothetical protein
MSFDKQGASEALQNRPGTITEPSPDSIYVDTPNGRRRAFLGLSSLQQMARQAVPIEISQFNYRTYLLALSLLRLFFGLPWLERYVLTPSKSGTFLGHDNSSVESWNFHVARVIIFAEMLFNLQKTAGLDDVLEHISGGQIESAYAELEAGKLLYKYGIGFRFVRSQKIHQKDYDIEFFHHNGSLVCAEARCKLESTDLGRATILSTLRKARNQLPRDLPGAIFLKVPQTWIVTEGFMDEFSSIADEFFYGTARARGSRRVVLIETFALALRLDTGIMHDHLEGREFRNQQHRFGSTQDWRLLTKYEEWLPEPLSWIRLTNLFPFHPQPSYKVVYRPLD